MDIYQIGLEEHLQSGTHKGRMENNFFNHQGALGVLSPGIGYSDPKGVSELIRNHIH